MSEKPLHLLLVDDDPDQVDLVKRYFMKQKPPPKIAVVGNGRACLEKLSKDRFSVVILDYSLPGATGLQVFEEIRMRKYDVPVIIVTGHGDEAIAVEAMKNGAYDYIIKKSGYERLLPAVVGKAVDRYWLKSRLAQSEERYQQLVDCALDVVCVVDLEGRIVMVNEPIRQLTGYTPEALAGKPLIDLIPPEDHILFQKSFKEVAKGSGSRSEYRILREDNTKQWVSVSAGPLLEKRKISGAIFILRDISDQKRAELELMRKNKELRILLDVGNTLASNHELDQILEQFAKHVAQAVVTTYVRIFLLKEGKLMVKAAHPIRGFEWETGLGDLFSLEEIPNAQDVLKVRQPMVLTQEALREAFLVPEQKRFLVSNLNDIQSVALVPLISKGDISGIIVLGERRAWERNPLTKEQISLCQGIAHQAAIAAENARLFEELKRAHFDTIQALAETLETKDAYTKGHSDRTVEYAIAVAQKLRLSEREKELLKYAAIFHDIGKIGVPDSILNKPARLTDEEYEIMKTHPERGANILRQIRFLAPVVPLVLHHQETYDGRGYPTGLAGEAIPIQSRIVAVLDAYDAMTSDRVYRKAPGKEYAISELKKYAGRQFDPKVVEVFLEVLEELG